MQKLRLGEMIKVEEGLATIDEWRNFYIVGGSRSGKTTFMTYLAKYQMEDHALIVIDPHGELAGKVATLAPKERLIYADINNPLVVNPLKRNYSITDIAEEYAGAINASTKANAPQQVEITSRMARILVNALEVFGPNEQTNSYLIDFLDVPKKRNAHFEKVLKTDFWHIYDEKGTDGINLRSSGKSITDRLSLFDKNEYARAFIEGEDEFDIDRIVRERKIVIFNLEHISRNARNFIGNLITYAIRTYINKADLQDSNLGVYVDEFHSFVNETFDDALVSGLKRGVNFVLAHQNHAQVFTGTIETALTNSTVIAALDVGETEAKKMKYKYPGLKAEDLTGVESYHCYLSVNKKPHYVKCYYKEIPLYIPPRRIIPLAVSFFRKGIIKPV